MWALGLEPAGDLWEPAETSLVSRKLGLYLRTIVWDWQRAAPWPFCLPPLGLGQAMGNERLTRASQMLGEWRMCSGPSLFHCPFSWPFLSLPCHFTLPRSTKLRAILSPALAWPPFPAWGSLDMSVQCLELTHRPFFLEVTLHKAPSKALHRQGDQFSNAPWHQHSLPRRPGPLFLGICIQTRPAGQPVPGFVLWGQLSASRLD